MRGILPALLSLYPLYSLSTSIAAPTILLLIDLDEFRNILVSFDKQCPPIPSLGSRMFTFHFVFSEFLNSAKFMLIAFSQPVLGNVGYTLEECLPSAQLTFNENLRISFKIFANKTPELCL